MRCSCRATLSPVLGAPGSLVMLAPLADERWAVIDLGPGIAVEQLDALDPTRALGAVTLRRVVVPADRLVRGLDDGIVRDLGLVLGSAESAGGARWCLDTASDYAKVRVQFGRPIGQFQAIKHKLADMLGDRRADRRGCLGRGRGVGHLRARGVGAGGERGRRDRPRRLRHVRQGVRADPRWHRLHLGARRAPLPEAGDGDSPAPGRSSGDPGAEGGRPRRWAAPGARWPPTCRPEAEPPSGPSSRTSSPRSAALEGSDRRRCLVESGLVAPHWPRPWGRDARPARAAGDRRGAGPRRRDPARPGHRSVGAPHAHRPRLTRTAGALGAPRP